MRHKSTGRSHHETKEHDPSQHQRRRGGEEQSAHGRLIVLMDDDGQHKPENILMLVAEVASYHMVVGVRAKASKLRVHRYAANALYNVYTYIAAHHFTNVVVFLLTTAVIIFMHGLVSQQIALLRMEQCSLTPREAPESDD